MGGRGIRVSSQFYDEETDTPRVQEFHDYIMKNLGERPKGHTLDRIDNDGNYEPGNLRWANPKLQANNRRNNVLIGGSNS